MTRAMILGALLLLGCKDDKTRAPDAAPASVRVADAAPSMARPPAPDAAAAAAGAAADAAVGATSLDGGTAAAAPGETAPKPTGKGIGVAACDEYLEKMARCIGKLSPESAEPMRAAMDDTRRAWQETAATAEGRAALADACRSALDAAKGAAKSLGCSW